MTTTILDGRAVARSISDSLTASLAARTTRSPRLTVILVGEDPGSAIYVRRKQQACEQVGIASDTLRFHSQIREDELLSTIDRLNRDPGIDGILVQLPLPSHIDARKVMSRLDPVKDVDGLCPLNQGLLALGRPMLVPCTPLGIISLIESTGLPIKGARAVVVGRSSLVGAPMAQLLIRKDATVTVVHSKTVDPKRHTRDADILIVSAGSPRLVKRDWVKDGGMVIDVGIHKTPEGLCGDVDFDDVAPKTRWISPVPGGVGPMTIVSLLHNTIQAFHLRNPS